MISFSGSGESPSNYAANVENVADLQVLGSTFNGGAGGTIEDAAAVETTSIVAALNQALEKYPQLNLEAAPKMLKLFDEWMIEFGKEYESLEEASDRMLIWLENHGAFHFENKIAIDNAQMVIGFDCGTFSFGSFSFSAKENERKVLSMTVRLLHTVNG